MTPINRTTSTPRKPCEDCGALTSRATMFAEFEHEGADGGAVRHEQRCPRCAVLKLEATNIDRRAAQLGAQL